jgi:UDP-3-O-[3-hydroxymyristoyl] glucosamine N-acyltransferase
MESLDNGVTVCGIPAISFMQWKRISVLVSKLPEFAKYLEASKRSWFSRMLGLFKK